MAAHSLAPPEAFANEMCTYASSNIMHEEKIPFTHFCYTLI